MRYAWFDVVGSLGVSVIILTYVLLQTGRLRSDALAYSILNASGASLIVVSLICNFNFAAFVVEFFWVLISLYGIAKYFLNK